MAKYLFLPIDSVGIGRHTATALSALDHIRHYVPAVVSSLSIFPLELRKVSVAFFGSRDLQGQSFCKDFEYFNKYKRILCGICSPVV